MPPVLAAHLARSVGGEFFGMFSVMSLRAHDSPLRSDAPDTSKRADTTEGRHEGGGFALKIWGKRGPRLVALPASGRLVIGRADECDICLDDASVSRRHAVLTLGTSISIEDLDSVNGTRVGKALASFDELQEASSGRLSPHAPAVVRVGDEIWLGATLLVVQHQTPPPSPVIVREPAMVELHALAARAAAAPINVLLLGETGVGKEVLAAAIHRASARHHAPLLTINCAAFAESLLESELFGHERGAFTGAVVAKPGLFEAASGGTLFLDEIGEMSLSTQARLLRVIEMREVLRVGATTPRRIDVRFIAATNRDLDAEVRAGAFRQDLFFRLNAMCLRIPPLRERPRELEPLALTFLERAAGQMGHARPPALSPKALEAMRQHAWPGNIRELRNAMERALVMCTGEQILPEHLQLDAPSSSSSGRVTASGRGSLREDIELLERARIIEALSLCRGNQTQAARALGISRRTLVSRLGELGLPRPRKR